MDFYLTRAFLVSFVRCCLRDNKVRGKGSVSWKIGNSKLKIEDSEQQLDWQRKCYTLFIIYLFTLTIIISYPTSASGIVVLLKMPARY